jgi:uncharacterized protein YdeI (YjbR/CyaY-like superfamily)
MALSQTPEVEVTSRIALRGWLVANHGQKDGVWLVTYKKAAGDRYLPYPDIVQECLCFGWVDSLPRKKDDLRSMLYISPRKPGSNWSRVNKDHVKALTQAGLMTPAGQVVIDRAKADGSWTALDDVENGVIPPDLAAAFAAHPGALDQWLAFPKSVRRGVLEILLNTRRPATRAAKIDTIATLTARGERPFQWR